MATSTETFDRVLFGAVAIDLSLATPEEIDACLTAQESSLEPRPIGDLLVELGTLTPEQVERVVAEQRRRLDAMGTTRRFGQIAVQKRYITAVQLGECIRDQFRTPDGRPALPLGQILLKKGYLTYEDFVDVVRTQGPTTLICLTCKQTYPEGPRGGLRCPECRGELVLPETFQEHHRPTPPPTKAHSGIWMRAVEPTIKKIDKYEVTHEIARGSMAVVVKAIDTTLGRPVALKVLREGDADPSFVERLKREARIAARLRHPNIVTIHEVGADEGLHFLCMDYIEGVELNEYVRLNDVPVRGVLELLEKIGRAVDYAHGVGVVHRDLKPANIIVNRAGEPVITDFGLAKTADTSAGYTKEGTTLGTPFYMPPEQVMGDLERVDGRSDVYSLGVILYELLTHAYPHDGATVMEVYQSILSTEPAPPRSLNRGVDRDLETVVLKAIEKDPEFRYQTAGEFADDLARHRRGEPVAAQRGTTVRKVLRHVRRARAAVIGSVAVVAMAAAVTALALQSRGESDRDAMQKRADALFAEGKFREAATLYEQVFAVDPQRDYARTQQALCLQRIEEAAAGALDATQAQADVRFDEGKYREAATLYEQVVAADAGRDAARERHALCLERIKEEAAESLDAMHRRADSLFDEGKYREASTLYEQIVGGDPDRADARARLALCLERIAAAEEARAQARNHYDAGLATLQQALRVSGRDVEAIRRAQALFDEAIERLGEAVRADPTYIEAYVARGKAQFMVNRASDAARDLETVLKMAPENFAASYELARMHYLLWVSEVALNVETDPARPGRFIFRRGRPDPRFEDFRDRAIEEFRTADLNATEKLDMALTRAWLALAEGDTHGAVTSLTQLAAIDVADDRRRFDAQLGLALAYILRGSPELAYEPAREAARLQPIDYTAHTICALCAMAEGDFETADAELTLSVGTASHPGSWRNLAVVKVLRGRPDEAIALFRRIVEATPDDRDARMRYAELLLTAGDPGAMAAIDGYLATWPDDARAWAVRATLLHKAGEDEEALALMARAAEAMADDANILANYAVMRLMMDREDPEAEKIARRALEIEPDLPIALNVLGNFAAVRGDWKAAEGHFEAAYRGGEPWAILNLARMKMRRGAFEEAVELLRKEVEGLPAELREEGRKLLKQAEKEAAEF